GGQRRGGALLREGGLPPGGGHAAGRARAGRRLARRSLDGASRRIGGAMSPVGTVAEIWRYPVKSMGGERLARSAIAARGLHADRMWAVRDVDLDAFTTARRWPVLLQCSARFAADPADRSAEPGDVLEVIVTFPDGTEASSSDPAIHDRLSDLI